MNASTGFDVNWYKLWMKQSQDFFDSANANLRDMFMRGQSVNPEEHLNMINTWLELLKQQWTTFSQQQAKTEQEKYWHIMSKIYSDAADMMMAQWMKRFHEEHPIKTIQELYELWLSCCHELYQKQLRTKAYQAACQEFMDKAQKFWASTTKK